MLKIAKQIHRLEFTRSGMAVKSGEGMYKGPRTTYKNNIGRVRV